MELKPQLRREEGKERKKKMYVGVHMAEKKGKRASERPHRSILQQFNYSILEEERADRSEGKARPHV